MQNEPQPLSPKRTVLTPDSIESGRTDAAATGSSSKSTFRAVLRCGLAAASVLLTSVASANDGDSYKFADTSTGNGHNSCDKLTWAIYNGSSSNSGHLLFMFQDGTKYANTGFDPSFAAVLSGVASGGAANTAGVPNGIFGYTENATGNGVAGQAVGGGAGVAGFSDTGNGVYGENDNGGNAGVFGFSFNDAGVYGQTSGVRGGSPTGYGVFGYSGINAGVFGLSDSVDSVGNIVPMPGVMGQSDPGIGVYGVGATGGMFLGTTVHLFLPDQTSPNPPLPDPTTTTNTYSAGSILKDGNQRLWYNAASGSPGTWRQVAGPDTAGSLHLVAPPMRLVDTRAGSGFADAGNPYSDTNVRTYNIVALSGGAVPAHTVAIQAKLAVVNPTASGNVKVSPVNPPGVGSGVLNFAPGPNLNVPFLTALDSAGNIYVQLNLNSAGQIDLIIDVVGYYR
jgi:hypothetical protein